MSETKSTKYVIEVASKGNKRLWFDPVKATLRGRWDVAHVAKFQSSGEFSPLNAIHETVPQIPGVHVWIDLQKGEAGYFDPLESTESR